MNSKIIRLLRSLKKRNPLLIGTKRLSSFKLKLPRLTSMEKGKRISEGLKKAWATKRFRFKR